MTQCYIQDAEGPCHCDNCSWKGDASELVMISDIEQRINAGGVVPAGQCPNEDCGALAYLDTPPAWARDPVKDAAGDLLTAVDRVLGQISVYGRVERGSPAHELCTQAHAKAKGMAFVERSQADLLAMQYGPELANMLILALPYVEDTVDHPAYKPDVVRGRVKAIMALLKLAGQLPETKGK